ncbi:hypothetical protein RND81_06G192300 [Saponaria officinalis]|uniref:Uncharacterized protein n=1 Tax=Saponaria officinalis TaxID=3572 RepID=A0AAW1K8L8_SAPOF
MADFPHFTKFLHFRSSSLSSPLFFPLHNFSSLRRRLSLSSLHPPLSSSSNSPNLLLISTSLKSDGSLVFKFGDASELPPAVEIDDSSDTVSVGAEIEVESEIGSDVDLAGTDNVDSVGKLDDDVDGDIAEDDEQNRDDLVPTSEIEDSVDVKSVNQNDDVDDEQNRDDLVSTLEIEDSVGAQTVNQNDDVDDDQNHDDLVLISEIEDSVGAQTVNQNDDVDDDQNHADLVPTSEVEASVGAQTVNQNDDVDDDQNHDDLVPTAEIEDSVGARTVNQNNDVDDDIAKDDEHNHDVPTSEIEHSVGAQTVNHNDAIAAVTDDDFGLNDSSIDVRNNLDSISEVALQNEEVDDRDSVVKHDDVDEGVEMTELPLVQSEAEPILDEEVNDADLPTIGGPEDSPTVDHADEASPSLVKPAVTSIETIVDRVLPREEISSDSGDISASSISMSSASASLSPPLKVTDAVPSAILQSDDCTERRDISEPAGPNSGPGSNSLGTASAEANIDSVQSSTVAVSAPSATASLQQAIEVNDAATPSIQQSDDIYVAAEPGPGISVTTEISLGEEISAPSLRLVSAAASLAHSAEVEMMRILSVRIGLAWQMVLASGHLEGQIRDSMLKSLFRIAKV